MDTPDIVRLRCRMIATPNPLPVYTYENLRLQKDHVEWRLERYHLRPPAFHLKKRSREDFTEALRMRVDGATFKDIGKRFDGGPETASMIVCDAFALFLAGYLGPEGAAHLEQVTERHGNEKDRRRDILRVAAITHKLQRKQRVQQGLTERQAAVKAEMAALEAKLTQRLAERQAAIKTEIEDLQAELAQLAPDANVSAMPLVNLSFPRVMAETEPRDAEPDPELLKRVVDIPVNRLGLSKRLLNASAFENIETVGDIVSEWQTLRYGSYNFGKIAILETKNTLAAIGVDLEHTGIDQSQINYRFIRWALATLPPSPSEKVLELPLEIVVLDEDILGRLKARGLTVVRDLTVIDSDEVWHIAGYHELRDVRKLLASLGVGFKGETPYVGSIDHQFMKDALAKAKVAKP